MNSSSRIVFGSGKRGGHQLLSEILETGWGHFSAADNGHLRPHTHTDAFELCLILSGEVEWCTADSTDVLRAGDVYITQPNEVHWGRDAAMHPCTLHWLILGSYGSGFDWPGVDRELAAHLDERLRRIQTHRLRGTPRLGVAFEEVFEEHKDESPRGEPQMLRQANARAVLHRLLIEIVRIHERQAAPTPAADGFSELPHSTIQAMEVLHGRTQDPDAVRYVCQSIGMDYKTLNQQFVEHLGTTISQYWLRERVRLARDRLLAADATVTEVANEFGFSSSQHFATVFRKITGLSPSEYRGTPGAM